MVTQIAKTTDGIVKDVRVMGTFDKPWFCGTDIAKILGYSDPKKAIKMHVRYEDKITMDKLWGGGGTNRPPIVIPSIKMERKQYL
jgi:prophage antirepressor-like protein